MLPETIVASDIPRNVLRRNVSQAAKTSVRERISIDGPYVTAERQNHPAAASDLAKCKKRTTAARVHFIVSICVSLRFCHSQFRIALSTRVSRASSSEFNAHEVVRLQHKPPRGKSIESEQIDGQPDAATYEEPKQQPD